VPPVSAREIESKYDVAPDFAVPSLDAFCPPDGRVELDTVALASTYHDTGELDLLRYRLTLRRREGDADTGWQLKIPGAGFRTELHWPVAGDQPPADVVALLAPFLGPRQSAPAVRLDVTRQRHRILDAAGVLIAEIAADNVRAVGLGAEVRARRWHEVEVELGPTGTVEVAAEIGAELRQAGAYPSSSRSKLARALLGIGNEGLGTPRTSAGAVLLDYVAAQSDALVAGHFAILDDAPDSVHSTRVACRRLRSSLRTFGDLFEQDKSAALRGELRWYAAVLGEVRDREVLRTRLAAAIAALPPELVVGPVAAQVDARLSAQISQARTQLLAELAGPRYAALLDAVTRWRDDPPFTAAAGRPAHTLAEPIKRAQRRLAKRLAQATEPAGTDEQMHSARKAGKAARYAIEAVDGAASRPLRKTKQLQELLGEFQDSIVATRVLAQLADDARSNGEDGFTYGILLAEQRARADQIRERARTS
jgi:CHAD domain-containing protein